MQVRTSSIPYSAIVYRQRCSLLSTTHCALVTYNSERVSIVLHSAFWMSTEVVCWQRCFTAIWLVPRETAVTISVHILRTPYNHATDSSLIKATKRRVHVCLAVTSHLHFWFGRMSVCVFYVLLQDCAKATESSRESTPTPMTDLAVVDSGQVDHCPHHVTDLVVDSSTLLLLTVVPCCWQ